ncbi:hypothetical protein Despr_2134 [Desulfobulbus propionicus DSM 2032]|uniref:SnoaL-like domain-containing protein n=1 Tax=Desulfobulbus propionicus (strain ATCC 33891 / DSM 2032 / VKM B-1956 / 1pr3) TaxID=577650 RepID=A0A7U4DPL6_DESPD|nr:hypothetical protein Despr_2134 [Desulfobulbus propionicus DSM 2032]
MVNKKTIVLGLLLVVAAVVLVVRLWPSDERAIRKQLALIEEAGSKEASEQPLESLLKAKQLAALFHDPCELIVEAVTYHGLYSRKEIMDRINLVRANYRTARVSLHDVTIAIPGDNNAVVNCTIRLSGEGKGQPVADVQELRAELRKIEGDWLLTHVTLIEVLER